MLVGGSLFQTVWNLLSGYPPAAGIRDYDLFYWDADTSYQAEDWAIKQAEALFADLPAEIQLRNQARVHLWFQEKYGWTRPPLPTARAGVQQFLARCTCVGITAAGDLYAPWGLDELVAGQLMLNPLNQTPDLFLPKAEDYRARWPWLTIHAPAQSAEGV